MKRLFFAFEIPEYARKPLLAAQEATRRHLRSAYVSWIPDRRWHITVHFMASVREEVIPDLINALQHVPENPIELTCFDITGYPTQDVPRVIVLRFADALNTAYDCHETLLNAMDAAGIPRDPRTWTPHVTFGRRHSTAPRLRDALSDIRVPDFTFAVTRLSLYESTIGTGEPVYTCLATRQL